MAKLTEGMVIARTRASDLENVKKLNCWGSELADVSLLRKMHNVEVLSLSVNNISSLADFQFCQNLQELYIRKNQIKNLEDICYLKDLPKLKNLWLEDNPCAEGDRYRLTVLKMLPNLQKLDNVAVQKDELNDAVQYGLDLAHPDEKKNGQDIISTSSSSPSTSPTHRPEADQNLRRIEEVETYGQVSHPPPVKNERPDPDWRHHQDDHWHESERKAKEEAELRIQQQKEMEKRAQQMKDEEYTREQERHSQREEQMRRNQAQGRAGVLFGPHSTELYGSTPPTNRVSQSDCNAIYQSRPYAVDACPADSIEENANLRYSMSEDAHRHIHAGFTTRGSPAHEKITPATRPYPVRPKTRNSNILSAVLCLIKELDYASLEVVEMAVRCRMDELED